MSSEFNRYARKPLIRVRRGSDGGWRAEADEMVREGQGRSPEAALGDWLQKNADRLGFDVRVD
ncbi:MAG: hypothetical protein LC118_17175 [Dehalococcoidia bacterium]|nr:hypothetical protein [Dehalococcoidia bacterium]